MLGIYVFLMMKNSTSSEWEKLVDITGSPALRPAPEMVDVSDMSHDCHLYVPGMKDTNDRQFPANYGDGTDFNKLKALEGTKHDFAVWLGGTPDGSGDVTPTGSNGKIEFSGYLTVSINEFNAGENIGMTISIGTQSEDTFTLT